VTARGAVGLGGRRALLARVEQGCAKQRSRALRHLGAAPRTALALVVGGPSIDREAALRAMDIRNLSQLNSPPKEAVGRRGGIILTPR